MERRRKQSSGKNKIKITVDRLSPLPDATLLHILSFLPTKLSVKTSVLARRWRFLWTRVPTLSFHTPSPYSFFDSLYDTKTDSEAIHRVMLLHQAQDLDTLSLIGTKCTESQLDTWISTAIRRNVRTIHIERLFPPLIKLPRLNSKTLVNLILEFPSGILSGGRENVNLPSLKKLHLLSVEYEDDEALVRFLSGCPVLEDFNILRSVDFRSGCCLKISSPTIKTLQAGFDGNDEHLEYNGKYEYGMMIDAPALVYLRVDDCCFKHITFSPKAMTSLVEVDLQLIGNYYATYDRHDNNYTRYVVKFLDSLCNVERLNIMTHFTMEFSSLQMLDQEVVGSIVKFPNLTTLEISNLDVGWDFLLKFIEIADNLQDLIADVRYVGKWVDPEQVPSCMISSLRSIKIDRMMVGEHELSMVRYLLRNSLVLERMELSPVHSDEPNWDEILFDAVKKISLFERGSPACELAFTRSHRR